MNTPLTPPFDGRHAAVGHLYSYDLRQRTPKGRRTLLIKDRGFHDFPYWQRCRREQAIYHLTVAKTNNVFHDEREQPIDPSDPRNCGVLREVLCSNCGEERLRRIEYRDLLTGQSYTFVTNQTDLPPGVLVDPSKSACPFPEIFLL